MRNAKEKVCAHFCSRFFSTRFFRVAKKCAHFASFSLRSRRKKILQNINPFDTLKRMIDRNKNFALLQQAYLFPEVARRKREYEATHPDARLISLSIGNTTEPLSPHIADALSSYAKNLATRKGYSGYGDEQGLNELREKIATTFYNGNIKGSEVFISDGAKCDIARMQVLFGKNVHVCVQNPAYPVYVDGSVLVGAAGENENGTYANITYLPCTPENHFTPDLSLIPKNSLVYFCSPNNPTGYASTKAELKSLVNYANANGCIIIFDAAYAEFIRDKSLPKSIFEIDGAKTCAIEINSFSKPLGFTGVRLGWSVVPETLLFADGSPVIKDWSRVMTTLFNGASNIAQHGGLAALSDEGLRGMKATIDYYLKNVSRISETLRGANFARANITVHSSGNSPYLWVHFPQFSSWDAFAFLLDKAHVITTPGSGFGDAGEGFLRFSAFAHHEDVDEACKRLEKLVFSC